MTSFSDPLIEAPTVTVGIAGAPGSGKTYSALLLGKGLAKGRPVFLINSERQGAMPYAKEIGYKEYNFPLHHQKDGLTQYDPDVLRDIMVDAGNEGAGSIVVDCSTAWWSDEGGWLDKKEDMDRPNRGASMLNWKHIRRDINRHFNVWDGLGCNLIFTFDASDDPVFDDKTKGMVAKGWKISTRQQILKKLLTVMLLKPDHSFTYDHPGKDRYGLGVRFTDRIITVGFGERVADFFATLTPEQHTEAAQDGASYIMVQNVSHNDEKGLTVIYGDNEVLIVQGIVDMPLSDFPYRITAVLGDAFKQPTPYQGKQLKTFKASRVEVVK